MQGVEQDSNPAEVGRLEGWKVGRLEGWKGERVEEWKGGRVEQIDSLSCIAGD